MSFKLVYLSQQDPQWKSDILGFGDSGDTIGYVGCALTSVAMLLSGHGYAETPKTLNQKLKNVQGFASAGIRWGAVSQIYPHVNLKAFIPCSTSDAPLNLIDAAIAAGQPAIVQVDHANAPGIQTHWVVLYGKKGDDYLMLDPWPYQADITKEDFLMKRYAQGNPLRRAISHVILYEAYGSGPAGPISTPSTPTTTPASSSGVYARVKDSVTWGLNVRSSIDTSSMANVVVSVPAGTQLLLLESDGASKIGAINQWVRVRTSQGQEGFAAAWYLEKATAGTPAPVTEPTPGPVDATPASTPATPSTPASIPTPTTGTPSIPSTPEESPKEDKLVVVVSSAVGTSGLRLRKTASKGGALVGILKAGTRLTVLDPVQKAKAKIGKANQWLYVRGPNNQRGYVGAEYVTLP
jgi:SH3 domain-containing protein/peptidase C39-like protein